jgi:hypothetical protein
MIGGDDGDDDDDLMLLMMIEVYGLLLIASKFSGCSGEHTNVCKTEIKHDFSADVRDFPL